MSLIKNLWKSEPVPEEIAREYDSRFNESDISILYSHNISASLANQYKRNVFLAPDKARGAEFTASDISLYASVNSFSLWYNCLATEFAR